MATYKILGKDKVRTIEAPMMSVGSSIPIIHAMDWEAIIVYNLERGNNLGDYAILKFDQVIAHYFGPPDEEVIKKHPLYSYGLFQFGAFQVENSSWITQLQSLTKDSDYHQNLYAQSNHYILTFHDSIFECAAKTYSVATGYGTVTEAIYSNVFKEKYGYSTYRDRTPHH